MSPENQIPNDNPPPPDVGPSQQNDIWRGVGLALLLHLIQIPLAILTTFISLIFLGVSQLVYIIPAIIYFYREGRRGVIKGLIIAAAITFLLNATCTALVLGNLNFH